MVVAYEKSLLDERVYHNGTTVLPGDGAAIESTRSENAFFCARIGGFEKIAFPFFIAFFVTLAEALSGAW